MMVIDAQTGKRVWTGDIAKDVREVIADTEEWLLASSALELFGGRYSLEVVQSCLVPEGEIHLVASSGHIHRIINLGA